MRLLIVGGAGAFGSFYAKMFDKAGFSVAINDLDATAAKKLCEKEGWSFSDLADISEFDAVIISISNEAAPKAIRELAKRMKKGSLLLDFCSMKSAVEKEYAALKEANLGLELASMHPMHGPRVLSISGFPVVSIPIVEGNKLKAIEDFFAKSGADLFRSTAKEHDQMLSVVQGLTHYAQFVSAATINELGIDLKRTLKFSSPNYSLFVGLMSRVVLQNPELYSEIQLSNPNNKRMRELFTKNANALEAICAKDSVEQLKKKVVDCAQAFKEPEVFLMESDRAVNAIKYVTTTLKGHIGKKFLVENVLTHSFHYGTIKSVNMELCMEEKGGESCIGLGKLRLCPKEDVAEWKKKNLAPRSLDYSFLVPKECDTEILLRCLKCIGECAIELVGEYESEKMPQGKKSLTIRAHFFEDDDKKEIDAIIKKVINGLGFTIR